MLGYIVTEKAELKVRELGLYNGYYCGLCKTIGEEYGQILRKGLSYDMAFLALFLASLSDKEDKVTLEHCITHHIKKWPVVHDEPALHYAADMMMILGYENFLDDVADGDRSKVSPVGAILHKAYKKADATYPKIAADTKKSLETLYELEAKGGNLDKKADCFARVMAGVFTGYQAPCEKRILSTFAENLGRWIYVLDAMDDYKDDKANHKSNPLFTMEGEDREKAAAMAEPILYHYLGELVKAYDLLDIRKNKGILDNVIYLGLRRKTDEVLSGKGTRENGKRSI